LGDEGNYLMVDKKFKTALATWGDKGIFSFL
jgi:hypothetical protein